MLAGAARIALMPFILGTVAPGCTCATNSAAPVLSKIVHESPKPCKNRQERVYSTKPFESYPFAVFRVPLPVEGGVEPCLVLYRARPLGTGRDMQRLKSR